jgi:hypothetical protein
VVKAEGGGKTAGEGGGAEVVRHYMHLFMALCAQRHELLHALIDAYVQASAGVRSAVQASITDMIKAIGADSPVLLRSCAITTQPPLAHPHARTASSRASCAHPTSSHTMRVTYAISAAHACG